MNQVRKQDAVMFHRVCTRPSTSISIKESVILALRQHCHETGERSISEYIEKFVTKHLGGEEAIAVKVKGFIDRTNALADGKEQETGEPQERLTLDEYGRLERVKTDY
jgi:hypothetical protein